MTMSLPDPDSLEDLSVGELRGLVAALIGEVSRLHAENQALRDEIARLKGLPARPPKTKPSGMEKTISASGSDKEKSRSKRRRGAKRLAVTNEVICKVSVPVGSRFKGYEDLLVQDLELSARVIRYRRERWVTSVGETIIAPVPDGIGGGFGANLRRFVLYSHIQGQVTSERLVSMLDGIGVSISKRQVVRLLTGKLEAFAAEDEAVMRAGLTTARWISVDDTSARHARRDGYTTQIGDDRFTAFRTGYSKSRLAFLSALRASHDDYVINAEALTYMRHHSLAGPVIDALSGHGRTAFANGAEWRSHLAKLRIDRLEVTLCLCRLVAPASASQYRAGIASKGDPRPLACPPDAGLLLCA